MYRQSLESVDSGFVPAFHHMRNLTQIPEDSFHSSNQSSTNLQRSCSSLTPSSSSGAEQHLTKEEDDTEEPEAKLGRLSETGRQVVTLKTTNPRSHQIQQQSQSQHTKKPSFLLDLSKVGANKQSGAGQVLPKNTPKDDEEEFWQPTVRLNHDDDGFVTKRGVLGRALESSRLQSKFIQTPVQVTNALPSYRENYPANNCLQYKQALQRSIRHDGQSSLKKQTTGRGPNRPSGINFHMRQLFNATNGTQTSKAETGGFSPASSSISAMEPDKIQTIKQSLIPMEKGFME